MGWYAWFCRLGLGLAVLVLVFGLTLGASALQESAAESRAERIARDLQLIHAAEYERQGPLGMGRLWAKLASDYEDSGEWAKGEAAYNRALQILEEAPEGILEYSAALDNLGSLYLSQGNLDAAEACRKRSYALREKSGDALAIARGKWMLAEIDLGRQRFRDAQKKASEAYATMVALNDPLVRERVATLAMLSYVDCKINQCALGVEAGREAKRLALAGLPVDDLLLGETLMALGYAEWKAGMKDGPDEDMREGVRILRERATPGHPYLLAALTLYSDYLRGSNRTAEAEALIKEKESARVGSANACSNCTVSVQSLRER